VKRIKKKTAYKHKSKLTQRVFLSTLCQILRRYHTYKYKAPAVKQATKCAPSFLLTDRTFRTDTTGAL